MGRYGWDIILRRAVIAEDASVSSVITVPKHALGMTIISPDSAVGVNWKLQSLSPTTPEDTETWTDAYVFDPSVGVVQYSFPFVSNQALSFGAIGFGGANLRISTYADTQTSSIVWQVMFNV